MADFAYAFAASMRAGNNVGTAGTTWGLRPHESKQFELGARFNSFMQLRQ